MGDIYAIYKFELCHSESNEGTLFESKKTESKIEENDKNKKLDQLFGNVGDTKTLQKVKKNLTGDKFPCTVIAHPERVILLRVERPTEVNRYNKSEITGTIKEESLPSFPYHFVIIDCRKGKNMIAIEIDTDAWRNTDTVANMLEENITGWMTEKYKLGIKITPQTLPRNFWDYNGFLIKKKKLPVKKLSIYFTHGLVDPRVEEVFKNNKYVKRILKDTFGARQTKVDYIDPDGSLIVSRKYKTTLEQLAILITSEIVHDSIGLSMDYGKGIVVSCGKDVRAEFPMEYETFMTLFSQNLFGQSNIEWWLDSVVIKIKELKDGTSTEQKSTRKRKKRVPVTSSSIGLF